MATRKDRGGGGKFKYPGQIFCRGKYNRPLTRHGPVAKETILDQWARWIAWLDMYVKNPKAKG